MFLIKALSLLLKGMLHYEYAVTALKINIENKFFLFTKIKNVSGIKYNVIFV